MRFRVEVKCKLPVAISAGRATGNETEARRAWHEELLQRAVRVPTHFGAGAARGLGRSEWRLG